MADGVAYVGSYDGSLYAIDIATGKVRWTYATGAEVMEPNLQIPLGILGSAAVSDGVVCVGDATATVHAVSAADGSKLWATAVDTQEAVCIWSSPVVSNGVAHVGVASIAKEEEFRGSVAALDITTGTVNWQTYMVPEGADGAGVFNVPAIDEDRGMLYVGTQNAYTAAKAPFGNPTSVVALDLASGEVGWTHAGYESADTAPVDDVAFSASPNLFSVTIDGGNRDLVGIGQMSGVYWALDRETGEVVWQAEVAPAGFLGGMEGTSAVGLNIVVVPATDWPEFDGPALGLVSAYDADTGALGWTVEQDGFPAPAPVAIADDLVLQAGTDGVLQAGTDGVLHGYQLENGNEIISHDLGASVSSGIAVAGGTVIVAAVTPAFAPFIKTGNAIHGFSLNASLAATPVSATPVS